MRVKSHNNAVVEILGCKILHLLCVLEMAARWWWPLGSEIRYIAKKLDNHTAVCKKVYESARLSQVERLISFEV